MGRIGGGAGCAGRHWGHGRRVVIREKGCTGAGMKMGSRTGCTGANARTRGLFQIRSAARAATAAAAGVYARVRPVEQLEARTLLAAHVVGDPTVYATIQGAVTAAPAGGVINVDAGTYAETVTVNKSLTINGAQSGIDARSNARQSGAGESIVNVTGAATFGFKLTADDVTIDGFTVKGNSGIPTSEAGIIIGPNQSGAHILDNIVHNNVAGMYLANASATDGALIQHNVFSLNNLPGA